MDGSNPTKAADLLNFHAKHVPHTPMDGINPHAPKQPVQRAKPT